MLGIQARFTHMQTGYGIPQYPIYMTCECDRLSKELVHTCPGQPRSGLKKHPVRVWVRIQEKMWTLIAPEPMNRHTPDPRYELTAAHK